MLNRIFKIGLLGFFYLVIASSFFSCQKAENTIAVILVKDANNNPVDDARVVLHTSPLKKSLFDYGDEIEDDYDRDLDELVESERDLLYNELTSETSDIVEADWTDGNGRAEFNFPLNMTLNISVLKLDGNAERFGAAVISVESEKTTTKTVRILDYND